ncbi:TetR-like C-terminal domain-containing protein [Melissococcus plutonius]|uniref:Transcriptional regulator, TetR family n=1 Tax=Melissococcus plutonius (strain ATCC 35311 / DSM 29964 / CIP 104052 / LMG 20360 / NCIMB 702443) TaxID=940190 RepID=F3Y9I3_MELPT|nr:TetR-like C-terminal domain-containing protein [Melissococcus plutonius]AIM25660.1 transcriptional regulator, TetR family [Melissococcus plutonius S1]KMT24818.1 transcriptional regulator, TetR family [Melissococcus plutonius]KMT26455.1 transcriptional regulator, TetR family [Melissococcus plutonius]KMT27705.1 transcriptional regulator, TetR family [Melissococcus plutonius]KMT29477.1 transcriptional regulator, TetR family [Melissococcus plutonius]
MKTNTKKEKTKQKIYNALIKLAEEKNIKEVKVSELCRVADINRSTFYLHYQDTYDLIEKLSIEIITEFINNISEKRQIPERIDFKKNPTLLINYQDLLEAIKDAQKAKVIVTMMLGKNGDPNFYSQLKVALWRLLAYFFNDYLPDLKEQFPLVPDDYLNIIFFDVPTEIILHWLEKGMVESPEEIGAILTSANVTSPLTSLVDKAKE